MPDGTSENEGCAVVSEAVSSKTRHHLLRGTPGRARSAGIINPCDALLLRMMRHCTQQNQNNFKIKRGPKHASKPCDGRQISLRLGRCPPRIRERCEKSKHLRLNDPVRGFLKVRDDINMKISLENCKVL
jgi:hypothetical protein